MKWHKGDKGIPKDESGCQDVLLYVRDVLDYDGVSCGSGVVLCFWEKNTVHERFYVCYGQGIYVKEDDILAWCEVTPPSFKSCQEKNHD